MTADHRSSEGSIFRSFKKFSAILVIGLAAASMTGCNAMSDSTKDEGKTAICAAGAGLAAQIKTGGAVGKFAAGIVRDNSTGEIKTLAEQVASGQGDVQASQDLANYVDGLCK
jgi:hypothetical protein